MSDVVTTNEELNQQQVDDNQSSQVEQQEEVQVNPESDAISRSQAREQFFASQSDEDIDNVLSAMEAGIYKEPSDENKSETKSEKKEGDDNGVQEQVRRKEEEVVEEEPKSKLGETTKEIKAEKQEETQPNTESEQERRKYKIKANGKEWEYDLDQVKLLASKGIDYTKKLQALSPYRKMINAVSENGITEDDINQLIEMKKGNKDAIGAFTKKYNIALSDIEEGEANAQSYKPQSYGREYSELQEIDAEIRGMIPSGTYLNQAQYDNMVNFFNNTLTNADRELFEQNPQALHILANDFKTGMFDRTMQEVERLDNIEYYKRGVRLIDKYIDVNNRLTASIKNNNSTQQAVSNQQTSQQSSVDKSKLGLTGTSGVAQKSAQAQVMEDLTDEDFEKFFKEKMGVEFSGY